MIIRYRMNNTCTLANLQTDLHNIISGNITSTADFSTGCDTTNSIIYGTYPVGIYSVMNSGSYTYSKVHNDYGADYTHYFRLSFDSTQLTGITLAQSYTSGSDTLVNSQALTDDKEDAHFYGTIIAGVLTVSSFYRGSGNLAAGNRIENLSMGRIDVVNTPPGLRILSQLTGTTGQTGTYQLNKPVDVWAQAASDFVAFNESSSLNVKRTTYSAIDAPYGIDIVITDKCFMVLAANSGMSIGIVDIGKNGVTRSFTNSMLMASIDLNAKLAKIPYSYKYTSLSYGTMVDSLVLRMEPVKKQASNGNLVILENPLFIQHVESGYNVSVAYGMYTIPTNTYASNSIYTDGSTYRITANNFVILGA